MRRVIAYKSYMVEGKAVTALLRVAATALLAGIGLACPSAPPGGSAPPEPASVAEAATSGDRCADLPLDGVGAARGGDCPDNLNSDHTPKRFPAPPPGERGQLVLLHYDDFGPQAMAGQLIGNRWWSWEAGGSFERCDDFDIRVVVFDARAEAKAKARYPTIPGRGDYRLVERDRAIQFLDERIAELAMDPDLAHVRLDLQRTRATITTCLPN